VPDERCFLIQFGITLLWRLSFGFQDYFSSDLSRWVHASFLWQLAKEYNTNLPMIYVTAIVSLFLFIYLFVALIRPEWF
jgi:K+-transporting ATPase KdpF subunit